MEIQTAAIVDMYLRSKSVEEDLRRVRPGAGDEQAAVNDALRHATVTRRSLEKWVAARQVRDVAR